LPEKHGDGGTNMSELAIKSECSDNGLLGNVDMEKEVEEGQRATGWAIQFERLLNDKAGVATMTVRFLSTFILRFTIIRSFIFH